MLVMFKALGEKSGMPIALNILSWISWNFKSDGLTVVVIWCTVLDFWYSQIFGFIWNLMMLYFGHTFYRFSFIGTDRNKHLFATYHDIVAHLLQF